MNSAFHYGLLLPWILIHALLWLYLVLLPCPCCLNIFKNRVKGSWLRKYVGLALTLFIFDIGWGLGLPTTHPLYVENSPVYAQVVFSVANGFLGLILFIFYCLLSKKVRQTYNLMNVLRRSSIARGNWQKQSGLYDKKEEENIHDTNVLTVEEEEPTTMTFEYNLDEVYGNPAVIRPEEEYAFVSETQFN